MTEHIQRPSTSESIQVRLFAQVREIAGRDALQLDIPPFATVKDVRRMLVASCPALEHLLSRSALAVNRQYAQDSFPVTAGDEVAVIPPVAGG